MKAWLLALKLFYREYTVYNLLFTGISAFFIFNFGQSAIGPIIWIKIFGYIFTTAIYFQNRMHRLYFFYNMHFSLKSLFISTFILDVLLTVLILIICHP